LGSTRPARAAAAPQPQAGAGTVALSRIIGSLAPVISRRLRWGPEAGGLERWKGRAWPGSPRSAPTPFRPERVSGMIFPDLTDYLMLPSAQGYVAF